MSSWWGCRSSAVRLGLLLSGGAFSIITFHIRESALRVRSLVAGNALAAATFAPVAPHGELYSLGEHGRLWQFWPTRAPRGALWHIRRTCEPEAYSSDRTPFARLPEDQHGVRIAPILLRF